MVEKWLSISSEITSSGVESWQYQTPINRDLLQHREGGHCPTTYLTLYLLYADRDKPALLLPHIPVIPHTGR